MTYTPSYDTPDTCFKAVVKTAFYREAKQTQERLKKCAGRQAARKAQL